MLFRSVSHVDGGKLYLINDGLMPVSSDPAQWTSGRYAGTLVGMYQPIARK